MLSTVADTSHTQLAYARDLYTCIQPISLTISSCKKQNFLNKGTEVVYTTWVIQ